jgi:hypothetical protein
VSRQFLCLSQKLSELEAQLCKPKKT